MKNRLMIFTITMVVFCGGGGVTSCTQEPNLAKEPLNLDPHHISVSEAIETMESAISELYGVSATRSFQGYKVETLKGADMQNPATRSADEEPLPEDLLYVVNFENESGFVVLAADDRLDPILCITEAGSLSVSDIIGNRGTTDGNDGLGGGIPFKPKPDDDEGDPDEGEGSDTTGFGKPIEPGDFIGGIIGDYLLDDSNYFDGGDAIPNDNDIDIPIGGGSTGGGATEPVNFVKPLLTTKWGQGYPYNSLRPEDSSEGYINGFRNPAGCAAIAFAQILAYYKMPSIQSKQWTKSGIKSLGSNPNSEYLIDSTWRAIVKHDYNGLSAKDIDGKKQYYPAKKGDSIMFPYIAMVINSVAEFIGISDGGTLDPFDLWDMNNRFEDLGYSAWFHWGFDNNMEDILNNLRNNRPVIISAGDGFGGHTWVIDGFKYSPKIIPLVAGFKSYLMVHCNWGWGGDSDGYYLPFGLSSYNGYQEYDSETGNEADFFYNWMFSTITIRPY